MREAAERGASQLRDGEAFSLECISAYATTDLTYEVNIERSRVTVDGAGDVAPTALRTTTIIRRKDDGWRMVHRHADPITSPRPVKSIVELSTGQGIRGVRSVFRADGLYSVRCIPRCRWRRSRR